LRTHFSLEGSVVIDASADGPLDQISFADGSTGSLSAILAQATTGITAATNEGTAIYRLANATNETTFRRVA
jgi:hypothetical protein